MKKTTKQEGLVIPKKAMLGIAPAIAISAILISKHNVGALILFFVGITVGIIITRGFYSK